MYLPRRLARARMVRTGGAPGALVGHWHQPRKDSYFCFQLESTTDPMVRFPWMAPRAGWTPVGWGQHRHNKYRTAMLLLHLKATSWQYCT